MKSKRNCLNCRFSIVKNVRMYLFVTCNCEQAYLHLLWVNKDHVCGCHRYPKNYIYPRGTRQVRKL